MSLIEEHWRTIFACSQAVKTAHEAKHPMTLVLMRQLHDILGMQIDLLRQEQKNGNSTANKGR